MIGDYITLGGSACADFQITEKNIMTWWKIKDITIGVFDTLSDSIQCLNFAKKWFIQYSIQYRFTQDSIQNIIQLKKNAAGSI